MLGESGNSYSAQCLAYRQIAAPCDLKVQQTKENQKKFLSLEAQIETYSGLVDSMEQVLQKIKPWMVDLLEYNAQKKKDALVAINTALSVANYIVPSSMSGIKFRVEGKEAWLENSAGVDVDRVEGSGYKGVVSVYLRDVIVRSNPSILQFMILDEPLSKLASENAAILSTYVPLLAENMQIIWIEHKKEVFANVEDKVVYNFFKDDQGHTICLREENCGS